ncbi:MAG: tRNA (adenosine(37)-N6)-threonylcarbamoyltransferase complex ATPase subunit type 1 TsaE [Candidatus Nanopelagicus sp.]
MESLIDSVTQMHQLGAKIGSMLKSGDVVVLTGELGSGKTTLTQGIASAFGIDSITSPTFVISRIHKGAPNFIHVDAYRLIRNDLNAFSDLDFESYLKTSVFVIEWGSDFVNTLSDQFLEIIIKQGENENSRVVSVIPIGERWAGFQL